jgi:hypothetical protein
LIDNVWFFDRSMVNVTPTAFSIPGQRFWQHAQGSRWSRRHYPDRAEQAVNLRTAGFHQLSHAFLGVILFSSSRLQAGA